MSTTTLAKPKNLAELVRYLKANPKLELRQDAGYRTIYGNAGRIEQPFAARQEARTFVSKSGNDFKFLKPDGKKIGNQINGARDVTFHEDHFAIHDNREDGTPFLQDTENPESGPIPPCRYYYLPN